MREFSEIEKILLERVVLQMINYLPEAWENVAQIKPRLEKVETNSQFAQFIGPTEPVALVIMTIKIGSAEGTLNMCLPHLVMETIMDKLYTKYWYIQRNDDNKIGYRENLEAELEKAQIPVSAVIGKTSIMVHDFINLQVGDILKLDSYISSDMNVMIGNMLKFYAKPGINKGRNAIQITSLVEKEAVHNG
jgi:flagellar motor switch protein FliM